MCDILDVEITKCPICQAREYEIAYKRDYRLSFSNNCLLFHYRVVICKNCGMIYTNPIPTDDAIKFIYESDLRFGETSSYFREKQIDFISRNISKDDHEIFDIGAFDGLFLALAKKNNFKVFGIEPSIEAVLRANEKHNISLIHGFFDNAFVNNSKRKFDIVTASHVLEHIKDPIHFLKLAAEISNKFIFVEVPDSSRPFINNLVDFFSYQHIMHFTESSLINIATCLDLEVFRIEKTSKIPTIRILFKKTSEKTNKRKKILINEFETNKKIIKDYKIKKRKFLEKLKEKIDSKSHTIIIYGAGIHTTQLLQSGLLDNFHIEAIVDSDPKKHGLFFENFKIQSPEIFKKRKESSVLISSYDSQEDISDYLSQNYPLINQIKLYDNVFCYDKGIS